MKNKIINIINDIFRENNDDFTPITLAQENDDLSDLGMDSIIFVQTIVTIEEAFSIRIPDEKLLLQEMNTIKKIDKLVSELCKSNR